MNEKSILIVLLITILTTVSVVFLMNSPDGGENIEPAREEVQSAEVMDLYNIKEITYEEHDYIVVYRGGILHLESCEGIHTNNNK